MAIALSIDKKLCIKCGRCVKVCPAKIFIQEDHHDDVGVQSVDSCIICGHCVAVCPEDAVLHADFPVEKVHKIDYSQLPTPEQMMLLCRVRRSNRAFSSKQISEINLDLIVEAAHRAPTGSNTQHVKFLTITNAEKLRQITEFTIRVFNDALRKVKNPLIKPILKLIMPDALRYIPTFERILDDYNKGGDEILRKATAAIFIYTPKATRMGVLDANLAYQNGSLMAESLGISQFYTGFVLNASKMKKGTLERLLGIDGEIHAGMALGMPAFRFPKYIDRKDIKEIRIL